VTLTTGVHVYRFKNTIIILLEAHGIAWN